MAPLAAAMLLAMACLLLFWPGIAVFDTARQYEQALAGRYDDWHPPVMAWLWACFLHWGFRGTAPMLLLQVLLYWLGIGLFAGGLARSGARRVAWAALIAGLFPLTLDWLPVVTKDVQMVAAMVAATGIVGWYRLARRRVPWPAGILAGLLLGYAVLVRANAAFAVVPLGWALAGWGGVRRWPLRAGLLFVTVLLVLAGADLVGHGLIGADRSHVEKTLPLFDLAGIAHRVPGYTPPGLDPGEWVEAERRHCYTPFYWDPFGDPKRCEDQGDAIVDDGDDGRVSIERDWIAAIAAHPFAYAGHRLAHLNATLRATTTLDEPGALAPPGSGRNAGRLGAPATPRTRALQSIAGVMARSPLGSPAVWLGIVMLFGWVLLASPPQPARDLGLALALSAMLMTASFAVVSIASDLRYHLWLIVAGGLVAVSLAACRRVPRGRLVAALIGVTLLCLLSAIARGWGVPIPS